MATSAQFPEECSANGEFERPEDAFRGGIRAGGSTPWAQGALIGRHLKRHYYGTHTEINPTQIVPIGPDPSL